MKIVELLTESYGGSEYKYPYGRGIMRGDVIKHKETGEQRTVTAVEGTTIVLDNDTEITSRNDWIVVQKAKHK
jgi:hypothetical protein